jgi:short-subunit dehydrogenase
MSNLIPLQLQDGVAVITGAAGGIGASLAMQLAAKGCHLALIDFKAPGLEATAEKARALGVKVTTQVLDMSNPESVPLIYENVMKSFGRVTVLINNAGVALGGTFDRVAQRDFDWLMSINFTAVVHMTRAFLPVLEKAPNAQIVNLSSIFGIIAPPMQTAYCSSKYAVRGFSESLRHELEMKHSRVGITQVHPGGIKTGIADNAKRPVDASPEEIKMAEEFSKRALKLSPDICAAQIIAAIEQRQRRLIVGTDAKVMTLIQRLFPVGYWRLLRSFIPRPKTS